MFDAGSRDHDGALTSKPQTYTALVASWLTHVFLVPYVHVPLPPK